MWANFLVKSDFMRLDLSFWEKENNIMYGIAVTIDYEQQKYGWKAKVYESQVCVKEVSFGELYVDYLAPPHKIPSVQNNCNPSVMSTNSFIEEVISCMDHCIIYTGAGVAAEAGVWDLSQLRKHLFLIDVKTFIFAITNNKSEILETIKKFACQLYETKPTEAYFIISDLAKRFNITVISENRDMLHQKAGHNVITRDKLKQFPIYLLNKSLIIVGLSNDHSGFIHLYRSVNKNKPIFIINKNEIPSYCSDNDFFLMTDSKNFFRRIREHIL